jgi:hypothetical protein
MPHPGKFPRKVVAAHAENAGSAGVAEQGNAQLDFTTPMLIELLFSR